MTTKLKIPKIRFKEFSSEWEEKKVNQINLEVIDGDRGENYPNGNDFSSEGFCLFMNAKNVTNGGFVFNEKSFITKEKDEQLNKGKLKRGDLVLTTRGTIGNFAYFDEKIKFDNLRINSGMVILRNNNQSLLSNYIYKYFDFNGLKKQISRISFGSAQPQLTVKDIKSLKISFPQLPEQQKIASFLSSVDEKIEKIKEKKKNLEEYKKGVMQKIFSQEIRFKDENGEEFGEWEEKKLGECILDISDGGTPSTTNSNYFGGNINWIVIEDIKDKIFETKQTLTNEGFEACSSKLWEPGTIILSTGATIGNVGITYIKTGTKQGICGIIVNEKTLNLFLKFWFQFNKSELLKKAQGSSIKEIRPPELKKLEINLPTLKEQEKIADFLSGIDEKIEKVSDELEKIEEFKKGLLQGMFV